jgi:segregation and condensation protein B
VSEIVEVKQVESVEVSVELRNIIEALIFASDEPVTSRFIRSIVDEANKEFTPNEQLTVTSDVVRKAVADLNSGYRKVGSAFRIVEIAGGFVHATQEEFASWVGKLAKEKARRRLSATAVETLAIIAYKQPITKVEVEFIRGVNVDYIVKTLLEKDLIYISGRAGTPGRPLLYGTTQKFLEHFGLNEITDLPKPREIEELIGETEAEVDRRLLAEQQQLEFKEELEGKLEGHEGVKQKPKEPKQQRVKVQVPTEIVPEGRKPEESQGEENISQSIEKNQSEIPIGQEPLAIDVEEKEKIESIIEVSMESNVEHAAIGTPSDVSTGKTSPQLPSEESSEQEINQKQIFSERGVETSEHRGNIETEEETLKAEKESPKNPVSEKNMGVVEIEKQGAILVEENQEKMQQEESAQKKSGWTKWKTKVKSFFQKIFG